MEVWINDNAARIRPGLRYIGDRINRETGELQPPIVLDKWTRKLTAVIDTETGEVKTGEPDEIVKKPRGACTKFTTSSVRRLKFNSLDFVPVWLLTLTYGTIPDVRKCYADLNRYLTWLRSIGVEKYVWVAEMQSRGALHFHVIIPDGNYRRNLWAWGVVDVDGRKHSRPAACLAWGRAAHLPRKHWCSCGRIERVRSGQGGRAYIRKYLSKGSDIQWQGRRWGSHRVQRFRWSCKPLVRAFYKITGKGQRDTIFGRETNPIEFAQLKQLFEQFDRYYQQERKRGTIP